MGDGIGDGEEVVLVPDQADGGRVHLQAQFVLAHLRPHSHLLVALHSHDDPVVLHQVHDRVLACQVLLPQLLSLVRVADRVVLVRLHCQYEPHLRVRCRQQRVRQVPRSRRVRLQQRTRHRVK